MIAHPVHCVYDYQYILFLVLSQGLILFSLCQRHVQVNALLCFFVACHRELLSLVNRWQHIIYTPLLHFHHRVLLAICQVVPRDKLRPLLQIVDRLLFVITRCYRILRLKQYIFTLLNTTI